MIQGGSKEGTIECLGQVQVIVVEVTAVLVEGMVLVEVAVEVVES